MSPAFRINDIVHSSFKLLWYFALFPNISSRTQTELMSIETLTKNENFRYANYFSAQLKVLRKLSQTKREYPVVENLNEYVDVFGAQRCFIILNNFRQVNILNMNYPVLITYPKPVVSISITEDNKLGSDTFRFLWYVTYPFKGNKTKILSKRGHFQNCRISRLKCGKDCFPDICVRTRLYKFTTLSKLWNCEVQIGLFPFLELYGLPHHPALEQVTYPRNFHPGYIENEWLIKYTIPSNVPPIHLFITANRFDNENKLSFQNMMVALYHRKGSTSYFASIISLETFFLGVVVNQLIPTISKLHDMFEPVIGFRLFRISFEQSIVLIKLPLQIIPPKNLTNLSQWTSSVSPTETSLWSIYDFGFVRGTFIADAMRICALDKYSENGATSNRRLALRRAEVWQYIFGNYTYRISERYCCLNGKIFERRLPPLNPLYLYALFEISPRPSKFHSSIAYEDKFDNLRFVSCGPIRTGSLLFGDLLGTYTTQVWICIIVTLLILTIANAYFWRRGSVAANMLAIFKILVGQGGPFTEKVFSSASLRFATVTMLFMGIILSEGYKNANVYNMVTPRKPVSYEKLQEIVSDNFTAHSRTTGIEFDIFGFGDPVGGEYYFADSGNVIVGGPGILYGVSDIERTSNIYGKPGEVVRSFLLQHTGLFPSLRQFVEMVARQHKKWYGISGSVDLIRPREMKLDEITRKWEETQLLGFLQKCEKAALVLPEHDCVEYAKRVKTTDGQHVSVGKEFYTTYSIVVTLHGLIPPAVLNRLTAMKTSGIWDWHTYLIRRQQNFETSTIKPTAATMSGNIVVIFLTLPVGIILSIMTYFLECISKLLQRPLPSSTRIMVVSSPPMHDKNIASAIITMLMFLAEVTKLQTNSHTIVNPVNVLNYEKTEVLGHN